MNRNTLSRLLPLFLPLTLFCGSGHCLTSSLSDYTYAKNASEISDDESRRLTYVKIGVAIGMFAITAGACSLPVVVITCITRRICSRYRSGSRSSALNSPSYASGTEEVDASSPTFLLDPHSAESDDVLIAQGSDSHRSHNHVNAGRISLYEVDSHDSSSGSHRLNTVVTDRNGTIPPSIVPMKSTRRRNSLRRSRLLKVWASRINCFAAGIFLTTGLMDLFPDVTEAMQIALSALEIQTHYPLAALFTLLGFFMVLTVEQSAQICHKKHRSSPTADTDAPHNHREHSGVGHSHSTEMIPEAGSGSSFQIILLLISLSVHSVFEGLAVGLQRSVSEVVTLFSALLLHKLIMAASIGFSLATSHQQQENGIARSQWMGALFFSLASPIGVLIGWALIAQRSSPALLMAIAVLQGLACGTFFFVVFCEMLPHEFGESEEMDVKDRFGKIAFLVLGFALIATYIAFGPE